MTPTAPLEEPVRPAEARGVAIALGKSGGGDLAAKIGLLATNIIAARVLGPAAFAAYAALVATALIAAAIWDTGVSTLVTTEGSRAAPVVVLRRIAVIRLRTIPLWLAALAGGFAVVGRMEALVPFDAIAVVAASFAIATGLPIGAWLRGRLRFGWAAVAVAAGRWTTAAICGAFLILAPRDAGLTPILAATAVGEWVVVAVAAGSIAREEFVSSGNWDLDRISVRRALPFAANQLLSIAYNRLDIVIVAALTTAAQVAAYAPASRLQDALYLLPTATAAVGLPLLTRAISSSDSSATHTVLRRIWIPAFAVAIPAFLAVEVAMPTIVELILGPAYVSAVPAARILAGSMILAVAGAPIVALLTAAGRGAATTRAFAVAFGVSIGLHGLLDPQFGAIGAAVASLARDVAHVLVSVFLARGLLRAPKASSSPRDAHAAHPGPRARPESLP